MDYIKTEESEEEIARVVVIDGLFRILMDEYILPRSNVLDLDVKNTGMTIEALLENGKPYEEVREMFIETVGDRTICGYLLSSMFCGLEFTPARYQNNELIGKISFELVYKRSGAPYYLRLIVWCEASLL